MARDDATSEQIHFITGRLAEHSLRKLLAELAPQAGFEATGEVLGITVAALMTCEWVARRLHVPRGTTRVILPGYCLGDPTMVATAAGVPVERGPKDLRELPQWFGRQPTRDYGDYDIDILAEINHAPRLSRDELLRQAAELAA